MDRRKYILSVLKNELETKITIPNGYINTIGKVFRKSKNVGQIHFSYNWGTPIFLLCRINNLQLAPFKFNS